MAVHAGRALFEQGIGDRRGNAQRGVLVWVYDRGTSNLSELYTDRTKSTQQDNPLTTNGLGNLAVFADPGDYEAHVDSTGAVLYFTVLPDWEDVVTGDEPEGGLPAHLSDAVDAHDASAVSFTPAGSIAATDVQSAVAEVATDYAAADAAHLADTSSAHVASAVGFTPAAGVAATDVQAAIVEIAGDVSAGGTALGDHLSDAVDSHDASAVSFVPTGGLAATTVQSALVELDSEKVGHFVDVTHPTYGANPAATALYNSEAINQAIADGKATWGEEGFTVYVPPLGTYMIDPTLEDSTPTVGKGIILDGDNIALWLPKGAVLKAKPMVGISKYAIVGFRWPGVGCSIYGGGMIVGDLLEHGPATGGAQAGHCIRVGGAIDTDIRDITLKYAWGDGLYVGENWNDGAYHRPSGLSVQNVIIDDVRREGIGHFNCDDARYVNVRIRNTGTTSTALGVPAGPQRGFDCEPNTGTPTEQVQNLTVIGMHISGCQGGGFVIAGGQGAICDQIHIDDIQAWNNGLSGATPEGEGSDWGIHLNNISRLNAGRLTTKGNLYDYGVGMSGDNEGVIESIISDGNLGGLSIDSQNDTKNSDLYIASVRAHGNQQRGLDLAAGPTKDIRIGAVDVSGNGLAAAGHSEVRLIGSGGKVVIHSGRIARESGLANYLIRAQTGTGHRVGAALVGTGTSGLILVDPGARLGFTEAIGVAISDETTVLTTGTAKVTMRMPFGMRLGAVLAQVATASSSGLVTVDINIVTTTVLSTKLSIDATEKTSATAATPAVISVDTLAYDDEITFDIDAAGTGATGLKVWLLGTRN